MGNKSTKVSKVTPISEKQTNTKTKTTNCLTDIFNLISPKDTPTLIVSLHDDVITIPRAPVVLDDKLTLKEATNKAIEACQRESKIRESFVKMYIATSYVAKNGKIDKEKAHILEHSQIRFNFPNVTAFEEGYGLTLSFSTHVHNPDKPTITEKQTITFNTLEKQFEYLMTRLIRVSTAAQDMKVKVDKFEIPYNESVVKNYARTEVVASKMDELWDGDVAEIKEMKACLSTEMDGVRNGKWIAEHPAFTTF